MFLNFQLSFTIPSMPSCTPTDNNSLLMSHCGKCQSARGIWMSFTLPWQLSLHQVIQVELEVCIKNTYEQLHCGDVELLVMTLCLLTWIIVPMASIVWTSPESFVFSYSHLLTTHSLVHLCTGTNVLTLSWTMLLDFGWYAPYSKTMDHMNYLLFISTPFSVLSTYYLCLATQIPSSPR